MQLWVFRVSSWTWQKSIFKFLPLRRPTYWKKKIHYYKVFGWFPRYTVQVDKHLRIFQPKQKRCQKKELTYCGTYTAVHHHSDSLTPKYGIIQYLLLYLNSSIPRSGANSEYIESDLLLNRNCRMPWMWFDLECVCNNPNCRVLSSNITFFFLCLQSTHSFLLIWVFLVLTFCPQILPIILS